MGLAKEWMRKDPFYCYKMQQDETDPTFLTYEELQTIMNKEFTIPRLALVKDIFIFALYTGLAFIDVYNLRPEHVSENNNGNLWIVKPREKTNNLCNIPLLSIPNRYLKSIRIIPTAWIKELYYPFPAIRG